MKEDLSERQAQLLKAIVEEYIETSEPVGSQNLVQKYNLSVSPATVRNEMAALTTKGYLAQPHTSAGRAPSNIGWRYYLQYLMENKELPILQEVALKQRLWQERFEFNKLLRSAALALSDVTTGLGIASTFEGHLFYAGAGNLLSNIEFYDIEVMKAVLNLLDHDEKFLHLVEKVAGDRETHVFLGEDLGIPGLANCSLVFAHFNTGKHRGTAAIIGPARMRYNQVIPTVKQVSSLLSDLSGTW
jgi:heat-inducible transcriptional repressor